MAGGIRQRSTLSNRGSILTNLSSSPTIGILILNRNGKDWLPPIYESLRSDGYANVKVYLVDNASEDGSVELTLEQYPEVTVIRMPQNLGYCMAYNLAMPHAFADGCEWVIWSNNDIKLEKGCLSELTRVAQSNSQIGILGPAFLAWHNDEPNYYMVGNHPQAIAAMQSRSSEPILVDWAEGSFLMVSRRCVEAIGPLDPYLFFYWEETDFCRRARYQGWQVALVPSALARHYAGGWSAGDPSNRVTASWLRSRNFYIYKLADPFQGFGQNLAGALHLFLVQTKAGLREFPSPFLLELRALSKVIADLATIHEKWRRDRVGERPPATTKQYESVQVEIIHGIP